MAGREHFLDSPKIHQKWNNTLPPIISIDSGDIVHFETREVSNGQITPACAATVLAHIDRNNFYPLAGPIEMNGAKPDDVLQVDIIDLRPLGWGWACYPMISPNRTSSIGICPMVKQPSSNPVSLYLLIHSVE
jgi:acetamidase/formamidase